MTARILPFPTVDTPVTRQEPRSRHEIEKMLIAETSFHCKQLLSYYKNSGLWNDKCQRPMSDALKLFQNVCSIMVENAHVKE
jgi:hypothetical protein